MWSEAVEILLEQLVFASLGRTVYVAAGCTGLIGPEKQATILLAHIPRAVGLTQNPHFG
jgi:hypothetical protein